VLLFGCHSRNRYLLDDTFLLEDWVRRVYQYLVLFVRTRHSRLLVTWRWKNDRRRRFWSKVNLGPDEKGAEIGLTDPAATKGPKISAKTRKQALRWPMAQSPPFTVACAASVIIYYLWCPACYPSRDSKIFAFLNTLDLTHTAVKQYRFKGASVQESIPHPLRLLKRKDPS
jgi:hypothetical protein